MRLANTSYPRFGKEVEKGVAVATSTETDVAKTWRGRAGLALRTEPPVHKKTVHL